MSCVPLWINAVDALPRCGAATTPLSCLHIDQLFHCDASETWTDILLANFMTDMEWLLHAAPQIAAVRDKLVLLSGEEDSATLEVTHAVGGGMPRVWTPKAELYTSAAVSSGRYKNEFLRVAHAHGLSADKVVVIEPRLPFPYGTHHTKMALCVNARGLRVAIFTANFVHDDWVNKTQGIYVQDFPRRGAQSGAFATPSHSHDARRGADFCAQLRRYLACCGVAAAPSRSANRPLGYFNTDFLADFDWSACKVWLVGSVPGSHRGSEAALAHFGMNRLAWVVRQVGHAQAPPQPALLSWQYSSQGSLNDKFLRDLRHAMLGDDADVAPAVGKKAAAAKEEDDAVEVQVVYPTEAEVRESLEGWRGGRSLPVRARSFHPYINTRLHLWGRRRLPTDDDDKTQEDAEAPPSPSGLQTRKMCAALGVFYRQYALPHIKSYARLEPQRRGLYWFLLTSANLSQAAWGSRTLPSRGEQKLFIRSYELGVLYDATSAVSPQAQSSGEWFSVTPSAPIALPTAANSADALFAIPLLTPSMSTPTPSASSQAPMLYLPYDVLHPVPYTSTTPHGAAEGQKVAGVEDVPWAVDMPHRGKDCLGLTEQQALSQHGFYGLQHAAARVRTVFADCTDVIARALGGKRPRDE